MMQLDGSHIHYFFLFCILLGVYYVLCVVCVCVCVCTGFIYHGGDLNLNTHRLMGTLVTVGTKIEVPRVQKASKLYRMSFFEKVKMHKVSCEG